MAASLGGLHSLVFTGGVGQNSPRVRTATADHLAFLGIRLEPSANEETGDRLVSPHDAPVAVFVIETREDLEMARQVRQLLGDR
jgi:acetate kinase